MLGGLFPLTKLYASTAQMNKVNLKSCSQKMCIRISSSQSEHSFISNYISFKEATIVVFKNKELSNPTTILAKDVTFDSDTNYVYIESPIDSKYKSIAINLKSGKITNILN